MKRVVSAGIAPADASSRDRLRDGTGDRLYANGAMQAGQIRKNRAVNGEVKELLRSAI